jgi:hypothetical protein
LDSLLLFHSPPIVCQISLKINLKNTVFSTFYSIHIKNIQDPGNL